MNFGKQTLVIVDKCKTLLIVTNDTRKIMDVANYTMKHGMLNSWIGHLRSSQVAETTLPSLSKSADLLLPLRQWLNQIEFHEAALARCICHLIPSQCPFARKIQVFGHTLLEIPPLCKLNPLYEELMTLRFRALCYLADECGEDISRYC
jgi:hypothetical protein